MGLGSGRTSSRRRLDRVAWVALGLVLLGPFLAWLRLVPALVGFGLFALGGVVCLVVGLVGLVHLVRGRGLAVARVLALVMGVVFIALAARSADAPRINDFTTDVTDPPRFVDAAAIPANVGRDLGYPPDFAAVQQVCCADLKTLRLPVAPAGAFGAAVTAAERMPGWTITRRDPGAGELEAVATTRVFGFQDDIAIRIRRDGDGSLIDVRSKSRDGRGDMGANAARIRTFLATIEAVRGAGA